MTPIRIGLLRLADSAPLVVAQEWGMFEQLGLEVQLSVEPSWANVADKLAYGLLDAAVLLPPLALALSFGLRGKPTPLLVPMGLSLGGNAVVLARDTAPGVTHPGGDALAAGQALVGWLRAQAEPPRLAVVHALSTHNLLLRHWLARAGGDPDRDLRTVVVPPEQVVEAMRSGRIAGFCAGAPWGDQAQRQGVGRVLLGTSSIWPAHPEKCLAVAASWASAHPQALHALLRGLLRAGVLCGDPQQAARVAALLASVLGLPEAATRQALPGGDGVERIRFGDAAWLARPEDATWFARAMQRWGWLGLQADLAATVGVTYRPGLLASALSDEGLQVASMEASRPF